jgi:hypothetical protein
MEYVMSVIAKELLKRLAQLTQNRVGKDFIRYSEPGLFLRVDGRSTSELEKAGGLTGRWDERTIESDLTAEHVSRYQDENSVLFSYGGCGSIDDTEQFIDDNSTDKKDATLLVGLARKMFPLSFAKIKTGCDASSRDYENEHMIIGDLPFSDFLATVAGDKVQAFLAGQAVPNLAAQFQKGLPKILCKEDLLSPESAFKWLYSDGCYDKCQQMVDCGLVTEQLYEQAEFESTPLHETELSVKCFTDFKSSYESLVGRHTRVVCAEDDTYSSPALS